MIESPGLFREGVAGNRRAAVPDGRLRGAGRSNSGRYDAVGDRRATDVPNSFTAHVFDQAGHAAFRRPAVRRMMLGGTTAPATGPALPDHP